ncbi:MAG: flagellar basal body rod protein FlgC [Lachnospiraceae bacterium]|nr:flagellar basal body rod protein FlgC [Lachnospiraceae bacterium]
MSVMSTLNVSASGMTAQRTRMDIIAQNIANVSTTRTDDNKPYVRQTVVFAERSGNNTNFQNALDSAKTGVSYKKNVGNGVKITDIVEDHVTSMKKVYDPAHPDADEEGYVTYPNVDTVTEMTNLISANRSYEANVTAFNATKNMLLKAMDIGS